MSTTVKVWLKAIERLYLPELVIGGDRVDRRLHHPEQVAELLGRPSVTFAKHIEVADGALKVRRQAGGLRRGHVPVVSVTAGVVEPRYPSFKGMSRWTR